MRIPTLRLETKERPRINSAYLPNNNFGEPRSMSLNTLMYWVKRTPECIGVVKRIVNDVFTDVEFNAVDTKSLIGRPPKDRKQIREDEAYDFWKSNHGDDVLEETGVDWACTGDGYLWKGSMANKLKQEEYDNLVRHYGSNAKKALFSDEDFNKVSEIRILPSTMTTIDHDSEYIKGFIQKSKSDPGKDRRFSPNDIIHGKFLGIDGSVYGLSPMESSWIAIKTINAIQDYGYNYFANGAKMDRAWLVTGSTSTDTMDKLQEDLQSYKQVTNARGDIVIETTAGDIKVVNLNEIGEEMEFRKLAINAVGRLAFAFNMPADTLSPILGADIKGTAMGSDIEDSGYNKNIRRAQGYWASLLNSQLFIPHFGVEMCFLNEDMQSKISEMQYLAQSWTHVQNLFKCKVPVNDEYIIKMLNIPRKYLQEGKIDRKAMDIQSLPSPDQQMGPNQKKYADTKKKQQEPQAKRP